MMTIRFLTATAMAAAMMAGTGASARGFDADDFARLITVASPAVAPGGDWVAYVVGGTDVAADKKFSHIWMTSWDGSRTVQLTSRSGESESSPHFSPDGKALAFVSARGDSHDADQLWLMDRAGGEARMLPGITGSVVDFAWSPDSKTLLLVVTDPDPDEKPNAAAQAVTPSPAKPGEPAVASDATAAKPGEKPPKPIVIDRFQFKRDIDGYLGKQRQRLWVYDIATARMRRLTTGDYDEALPAWSPDGTRIAFTSKRLPDPDRSYDSNLYIASVGAAPVEPTRLTAYEGADNDPEFDSLPAWSPDGRSIAYIQGGPVKLFSYGVHTLAVVPAAGGTPRVLTQALDRNVHDPIWSADGRSIVVTVEDDGAERIASVPMAGDAVTPVVGGLAVFSSAAAAPKGRIAVLKATPNAPAELFALEGTQLRQLTHQNDAWLKDRTFATTVMAQFKSKDGTDVHGFVVTPVGTSKALPAILYLHGGPQAQHEARFDLAWQVLASHGYVVIGPNPRGGTGRGQDYAKALYADWGGVAVADALAAVDDAVKRGIADPAHLGVGGWSYGGILTNYVIASDQRFKAAVSGASISNVIAGYGTDQYIRDYELELGKPWEHPDVWARNSYPFLHNDTIVTPTLFMVGDKDFNVPLLNSEQMYQALRSRNIDTQLVIYPGQFHGIKRPSFVKDRMERWLAWYEARVK